MDYVSTYFIVSLADAKRFLAFDPDKVDWDDLLGHLLEAASTYIENAIQRKIIQRALTEYYDGNDTDCIPIRSFPVSTTPTAIDVRIDSSHLFGTDTKLTDITDYVLDDDLGLLYRAGGGLWTAGRRNVKLAYTAGWSTGTVPKDLRTAAYVLLGTMWKSRSTRTWGEASRTGAGGASLTLAEDLIPKIVKDIIANYRSIR